MAQVAEATPSDADKVVDISEGVTRVDLTSGGRKKFKFTPAESDLLAIYSTGDYDTIAYLHDADGNYLTEDDEGGKDSNFKLVYNFTAGETYILDVGFYNDDEKGSFDIVVDKASWPEEINISNQYTNFLEGAYYPSYIYFLFKSKEADGGSDEFIILSGSYFCSGGFNYSIWIKDEDGNYTYTEDGTTQSFRDAKSLKAGKYTVELVGENKDEELEPVAGTKIWASYDIYVKSPDDLRHHIRHMSCQLDKLM